MCGKILSLILVLGLVSSALAVTAADAEVTVETSLGIGAITTYLELTNSTTGDTREGFSIVQAASGDDWGYPDGSDSSIFVNTNSLDDKGHAASDFLVTLSSLTANMDYGIYVSAAAKTAGGGKLEYDFSWGASGAGSADTNVDSVYNAPGAIELVNAAFGGDVKHNMAVPIGIFASDGSGNLSFYLGNGNNHQGSDADRTQLDGIIVGEGIPEPATIMMLGLGGLALIRKKRQG